MAVPRPTLTTSAPSGNAANRAAPSRPRVPGESGHDQDDDVGVGQQSGQLRDGVHGRIGRAFGAHPYDIAA